MALSRESEQKNDGFFNHGLNFFKNRLERSSDEATHRRVATEADPYGHVGSTKGGSARQSRDYSIDPSGELPEDEASSMVEHSRHYDSSDPFAEAYALLHRYGMIRFESQREDGSWEVYGLERRQLETEEPAAPAANPYSSMEEPQAIDPATQALLASELAKFTQNRKSSRG